MKVSSSKENILKKIRQALSNAVPVPFPKSEGNNSVYQQQSDDLEVQFAEEFTRLLGKFAFCVNEADPEFPVEYPHSPNPSEIGILPTSRSRPIKTTHFIQGWTHDPKRVREVAYS